MSLRILLTAVILTVALCGCSNDDDKTTGLPAETVMSLIKEDLTLGTGAEAVSGKVIRVHYTGTLVNGTKFDSSLDRGEPFEFTLGTGQVIAGWDQGIPGMKVGGKRKLTIPSSLGYGSRGSPPSIPGNATLLFDVELIEVKN